MIFDAHCHFNHQVPGDTVVSELYRCELDFLKRERKAVGIDACAMSTFSSVLKTDHIYEENSYLWELAQEDDWLYQWVVVDPRSPALYKQAEEMLKSRKTMGIKIHSVEHRYPIEEYADEIFSFANDHGSVVLMHPDHISAMPVFADRYPNMKLIIAHIGSVEHVDAIAEAKLGNIYTDTSGCASTKNNILEYALTRISSEKILFGTDTYAVAFQLGRVHFAPICQQDKQNILYENIARVFPNLSVK